MSERKDFTPVAPVKPESRGAVPPAPVGAAPQARPAAPQPVRLPAAGGGFGHVMRPAPAPQHAAAKPVTPAPQPVSAPRPAPAAAAPSSAAPAPAAAPVAAAVPVKAAAPAPSPKKPARETSDFAVFLNAPWLKGLNPQPFWLGYRKLAAFGGDGMQAGFQAGAILVRGFDLLAQEVVALAGAQMATTAAAAEEISSCRSIETLLAMQSSLAQASFSRLTAAADRLSQMSVALAEEVCEPIADEIGAAADRFIETFAR